MLGKGYYTRCRGIAVTPGATSGPGDFYFPSQFRSNAVIFPIERGGGVGQARSLYGTFRGIFRGDFPGDLPALNLAEFALYGAGVGAGRAGAGAGGGAGVLAVHRFAEALEGGVEFVDGGLHFGQVVGGGGGL